MSTASRPGPGLRSWLPAAVIVAAAAAAAALTTEGCAAVPPTAIGLIALGAAVVALVLVAARPAEGIGSSVAVAGALVFLGVVGAQDCLRPGLANGHDSHNHLWALWAVWRTVLDGDPTPLWIPYLGTGMPLLHFYSPLTFVLAAPAQVLGASAIGALEWLLVLAQVGSAFSAYAAVRWLGASRAAGLVAAAALVLAPYHLFDQTVRCALAECLAFALLPLFLAAAWKVLRGDAGRAPLSRAPLVLALVAPALLLAHPLSLYSGVLALLLLAPFAVRGAAPGRRPSRRLARLLLAAALGAGLAAAWWLPLLFDLRHTGVPAMVAGDPPLAEQSTGLLEPLERRLWTGYGLRPGWSDSLARPGADPGATLPLYFGCGWLALLLLAAFRPRSATAEGPASLTDPRPWGLAGLILVLLATRWLTPLLAAIPASQVLQFPWRLYGPATALAAIAGGLALDGWCRALRLPRGTVAPRAAAAALLLVLLALDAAPYLGAPDRLPDTAGLGIAHLVGDELVPIDLPRDRFVRVEEAMLPPADYGFRLGKTRRVFAEYLPPELWTDYARFWNLPAGNVATSRLFHVSYRFLPGVKEPLELDPLPYANLSVGVEESPIPLAWERAPERIRVQLPESHPGGRVWLAESWFPGWQARIGDGPWHDLERDGPLLTAPAGAGDREVTFRFAFTAPWYRAAGCVVSLLSLLCLALPRFRRRLLGV